MVLKMSNLLKLSIVTYILLIFLSANGSSESVELIQGLIADIQSLLNHNKEFYNKYGVRDDDINRKFEEAKQAATFIHYQPQYFADKVFSIQEAIQKKIDAKASANSGSGSSNIFFVDEYVLMLGTSLLTGAIRFEE